ncbi:MAG: apolipoprotein N-acyltransferase [Elusimicrobia bacterium]|nr:apolipoprotein N-acyltransferase [Elusimicrobiota bacterium]
MLSKAKSASGGIKKLLLCISSSVFIILSCPNYTGRSFWPFAWISLVPLFIVIQNEKPLSSFLYGILTGLAAYCGILYWLVQTFSAAGEPKIVGITALLLISLYLALYYGAFCFLASHFSLLTSHFSLVFIWVSLELLLTHLFTGFPTLLGYTQWNFLPIIQISEFTGVYGVSSLIILVNIAITNIITKRQKPFSPSNFLTLSLILICLIFGFYKLKNPITHPLRSRLSEAREPNNSRTVSILQGNIDQYKKWNAEYERDIIDSYSMLALNTSANTDLIIWPESAVQRPLIRDIDTYNWVSKIVRKTKTQHLIGSNDIQNGKYYVSAFLISADGRIIDEYSKNHLVPFGEYMPLRNILGKFIKVVNEIGEFSSKKRYESINSKSGRLAVNICFEAIFPNEIRKLVKNGAQVIVNITNDAWYLKTSAPYQHFVMNVFRAVENRRELVRAANTGISGFIDSRGRVKSKTEIFATTILADKVQLMDNITFYTRFGNVFAYTCLILSIICLTQPFLRGFFAKGRPARKEELVDIKKKI